MEKLKFFISLFILVFLLISLFAPLSVSASHNEFHTIQQLNELHLQLGLLISQLQNFLALFLAKGPPETPGEQGQGQGQGQGQTSPPGQSQEAASSQVGTPSQGATPAEPANQGQGATPAQPAAPAQQATPAQESGTPAVPSQGAGVPVTPAQPSIPAQASGTPASLPAPAQGAIPAQPSSGGIGTDQATPQKPEKLPEVSLKIERSLQHGSSGKDVKKLQEFLKQFPDIYPRGLATGFFGQASKDAVKKLQEKFGLDQVGIVGPKTKGVLEELASITGRKERPHIMDISPANISVGSEVMLTGRGFTLEDNAIFVKGRVIMKELSSPDGNTLKFFVTLDIPCVPNGPACPVKVLNKNGISNAKPFKLVESEFIREPIVTPTPSPTPTPTPISTPTPTPIIDGISPSSGKAGTEATLYGSSFTTSGNNINLAGVANVISGLSSSDGRILKFIMPSSPCKLFEPCSVSINNVNGTSNSVSFVLTQLTNPVAVTIPNGGEKFIQGASSTISWTGGTDQVRLALVEEAAIKGIDPTPFIVGWISTSSLPSSSVVWNSKEVCDISGTICSPVSPGSYKILAVSENEFGKAVIELDGSGNWDVSDQAFLILTPPSITLLSPNGGDKLVYGSSVTISWRTTSILSQSVKINLLKSGVFYQNITSFSQSVADGSFFYNWVVPSTIPAGSDYTIEISDSANPLIRDVSDSAFGIGPQASITIVKPNGGEKWYQGFQATVIWNSSNILSKAVNLDLYKGEVFVKQLASNVPQKLYSWSDQTYTSGSGFNYTLTVPKDIPGGLDYILVISDFVDKTTSDSSNAAFSIILVPDSVTYNGRLINKFTLNPLTGASLFDGAAYPVGSYQKPSPDLGKTDLEGRFSVTTSTSDGFTFKRPVGSWPGCYMHWSQFWFRNPEYIQWLNHLFDLKIDQTEPLSGDSLKNLGDVGMWPATGLYFYTDRPDLGQKGASPGVWYPDSSYWGWQILALEADLRVQIYDPTTNTYVFSPYMNVPLSNGCVPKTLTYLNGVLKWEPYNINASAYIPNLTVGTFVKANSYISGGVSPYIWSLYYGLLPPGLTIDPSTGIISGTPTTAGIYKFQIRVIDANGVNGGSYQITFTVK